MKDTKFHTSSKTSKSGSGKRSGKHLLTLEEAGPVQMGFWVPNRVWATSKYLVPLRNEIARKRREGTLPPLGKVVEYFKAWITGHSVYRMWVQSMIDQANAYVVTLDKETKEEIRHEDGDVVWIKSWDEFFDVINHIINHSPSFNKTEMVGTPLNGLLAICMATEAGLALFHDATFNAQMKKVLNAWNKFLKSSKSLDKLDIDDPEKKGSWISKKAWKAGVWDQMEGDPKLPGYGFDSWNSFFLRKFVKGARPYIGNPEDVINIGCETTPWTYKDDVQFETKFWIKDNYYSLLDLFGGQAEWAKLFEGGQLYQGFLSATHYHRWNSPMQGEIVRSWNQPGTYFAQRPGQGEDPGTWEGTESQPYLGHVATRAIFVFKHKKMGYVALICIGMVEVSTCYIEPQYIVNEGAKPVPITRGDKDDIGPELGHFEFGGSTHVMIFQKDKVKLPKWARQAEKHRNDKNPMPLGSPIAIPASSKLDFGKL